MSKLTGMTPPKAINNCRVQQIAKELDEADRQIFLEAVNSEIWGARALNQELSRRGILLGRDTIVRHRNKACKC